MGSAVVKVAAVVSSLLLVGGLVSYRAGAFDRWTQPAATPVPGDAFFSDFEEPVAAESFIYSTKSAPIFVDPTSPPEALGQPAVAGESREVTPATSPPSPRDSQGLQGEDLEVGESRYHPPRSPQDSQGHQGGSKSAAVFVPYDVLDRDPQAINAAKAAAVQPAAPVPAANTQNDAPPRRVIMSSSKSFVIEPRIAPNPPPQQPVAPATSPDQQPKGKAMSYLWLAIAAVVSSVASLIFLVLVFRPLEVLFPAKAGQKFFRPAWWLDLCFFFGQYLLWNGLVFGALVLFGDWLDGLVPSSFRASVAAQPWWLQVIAVIVLSDLIIYWGHRLQHRVPLLWRFHKVHHSAEHLDWLAAHREHPLDTIYTVGLINLPAFILGFPLETIAGLIAFRGIWAIYIHSNVRLPIGPLRMLIGAPELHHWHHDRDRNAGNYANISPLMDLLFGTYRCPDHEPESFGIREPSPRTYLGHMLEPLLPKRRAAYKPEAQAKESLV